MNQLINGCRPIIMRYALPCSALIGVGSVLFFLLTKLGITSIKTQLLIFLSLAGVALFSFVIKYFRTKVQGEKFFLSMSDTKSQSVGRQLESEHLKAKMAKAIQSLKTSELGIQYRGSAALYALPWYILIGPSSAGKSTLLRQSGIDFPHVSSSDDAGAQGISGTHDCDWWFSNQAIILDTAGRYTTENKDNNEWLKLLSILKKHRRRMPINGIVIAISLSDILTFDEEGINKHIKPIRSRTDELYRQLGFVSPVYLILTKCDLIDGFNEFFSQLSDKDRQQAWGIDLLPVETSEEKVKLFEQRLNELYQELACRRLSRMYLSNQEYEKLKVYDFPEQFETTSRSLLAFFKRLMAENAYLDSPSFCGVYLSSGTQDQGAIMQRDIIDSLSTEKPKFNFFKLIKPSSNDVFKSYFVRDVFEKVIFKNKSFARRGERLRNTRRWLKASSVLAGVGLCAFSLILMITSYRNNIVFLADGKQSISRLMNARHSHRRMTREKLQVTQEAAELYRTLDNYHTDLPWFLHLGLYRGELLRPVLKPILLRELDRQFLKPTQLTLKRQLMKDSIRWQHASSTQRKNLRGRYYSKFKAYLMLVYPRRMDVAFASHVLSQQWRDSLNLQREMKGESGKNLEVMVSLYLEELKQRSMQEKFKPVNVPDPVLIRKARRQLRTSTNVHNIYAQVRDRGRDELPAMTVDKLVTGYGADLLYSGQKLPGIYTADGYLHFIKPKLKLAVSELGRGDWVIDAPLFKLSKNTYKEKQLNLALAKRYEKALYEQYLSEYARAWLQFLGAVKVQRFESIADAADQYRVLYDNEGPITQLLKSVHAQLEPLQGVNAYPASSHVSRLLKSLSQLTDVNGVWLEAYFKKLATVQADIERLSLSPELERDAHGYAKRILSGKGQDLALYRSYLSLDQTLALLPSMEARKTIRPLLLSPLKQAWSGILEQAIVGIQQRWEENVYPIYQQAIATKFPFSLNSEDASVNDVADFLRPRDGVLAHFTSQQLRPFLKRDKQRLRPRQWLGLGLPFSSSFLSSLTVADSISQGLFKGSELSFIYAMYPYPTVGLKSIMLELNGQTMNYHNGPQEWKRFNWPGAANNDAAMLRTTGSTGRASAVIESNSVWGIFHLLAKSNWQSQGEDVIKATWKMGGEGRRAYNVTMKLHGIGRKNAFILIAKHRFHLPKAVFSGHKNLFSMG